MKIHDVHISQERDGTIFITCEDCFEGYMNAAWPTADDEHLAILAYAKTLPPWKDNRVHLLIVLED